MQENTKHLVEKKPSSFKKESEKTQTTNHIKLEIKAKLEHGFNVFIQNEITNPYSHFASYYKKNGQILTNFFASVAIDDLFDHVLNIYIEGELEDLSLLMLFCNYMDDTKENIQLLLLIIEQYGEKVHVNFTNFKNINVIKYCIEYEKLNYLEALFFSKNLHFTCLNDITMPYKFPLRLQSILKKLKKTKSVISNDNDDINFNMEFYVYDIFENFHDKNYIPIQFYYLLYPDQDFIKKQQKYIEKLPEHLRSLLFFYSNKGDKIINSLIRGKFDKKLALTGFLEDIFIKEQMRVYLEYKKINLTSDNVQAFVMDIIKDLVKIINKAPTCKKSFLVYRGQTEIFHNLEQEKYETNGILSTSLLYTEAALFSQVKVAGSDGNNNTAPKHIYHIFVPARTKCLYMKPSSMFPDEEEVIFSPKICLDIIDIIIRFDTRQQKTYDIFMSFIKEGAC